MERTILFLLVAIIISCKGSQEQSSAAEFTPSLDRLPMMVKDRLIQQCDYIDYIFYDLPISMSLDKPNSIYSNVSHITDLPINRELAECAKPVGRVIYKEQGEVITEADLYLDDLCAFFIFMEDNRPKFANRVSQNGIKFFQGVFNQVPPSQTQ